MTHHDIFNGDADGICALHQLRLATPRESRLVTGAKRDIELLDRVAAQPGDSVTVLDVSLDRNRAVLRRLLQQGVVVDYFDHHFAGVLPRHDGLTAHIDPAPGACTSTIVDRHLQGRIACGPSPQQVGASRGRRRGPRIAPRQRGAGDPDLAET